MSDRLPISRRRTAGGKHVAPAAHRPAPGSPQAAPLTPAHPARRTPHGAGRLGTRLAQGGLVSALALALGVVVVAPVWGQSGSTSTADAGSAVSVEQLAAEPVVPGATAVVSPAELAAQQQVATAHAAAAAVEAAQQAQAAAVAVAADPAKVGALQSATAELDALLAAVAVNGEPADTLAERTAATSSRSTERTPLATDQTATATTPDATGAAAPSTTPDEAASSTPGAAVDATDASPLTAAPGTLLPGAAPLSTGVDQLRAAVAAVAALTDQVERTTQEAVAAQEAAAAAAAAEAAQRAAWKASLLGYANGRIPSSALCAPSFDAQALFRCDAAEALDRLDAAYLAEFGTHLTVSDSYRSYAGQVLCKRTKGSLCAAPGTSNHGTGVAVDLGGGIEGFGTAQFVWMSRNAAAYGWVHPAWAEAGGSKPEAWHWEYTG
ncbi:M15 family metallopeptidase [Cellulomonas soli]|uniref:M15 family metallopeptidase n=1 Tax=Cellulomonas soli TaxID=931535 RepID=UPI003F849006